MIRWETPGYVVAFTTRTGGVSSGVYESLNLTVCLMKLAQPLLDTFHLKAPLASGINGQRFPLRQRCQGGDDSQVFLKGIRIRTEPLFKDVFSMLQNPPVRLRSERKGHVMILDQETSPPKDEMKLPVVEGLAIEAAEHW